MHKHHVTPRHEWKRRFGNLKGFNASDNVVWLTIEQHAEVHKLLYELNSSKFDFFAHQILSGLLTGNKEEIRRTIAAAVNKGNQYARGFKHIRSEEYRKNLSEVMAKASIGNRNASGKHKRKVLTAKHKDKIRMGMLSYRRLKSEESRGTQDGIVANGHPS